MSSPSTSLLVDFPSQSQEFQHKSKKIRRSSVHFSALSQMHIIEPIDRPWYTHQDEQQFHDNDQNEMLSYLQTKQAAQDAGVPHKVACPVGLEMQLISYDFIKKRDLTRKMVKAAIHMEQSQFYHEHEYDRQERIAAASIRYSEWSRTQALVNGAFQSFAST